MYVYCRLTHGYGEYAQGGYAFSLRVACITTKKIILSSAILALWLSVLCVIYQCRSSHLMTSQAYVDILYVVPWIRHGSNMSYIIYTGCSRYKHGLLCEGVSRWNPHVSECSISHALYSNAAQGCENDFVLCVSCGGFCS